MAILNIVYSIEEFPPFLPQGNGILVKNQLQQKNVSSLQHKHNDV